MTSDAPFEILPARADDLPSVVRLLQAETREGEYPALAGQVEAWVSDGREAHDFMQSESYWLLVTRKANDLVGHAAVARIPKLDPRRGTLYLDELYVLKDFRRQGAATALVGAVIDLASESDCHLIRLVTGSENTAARTLYHSLGFSESYPTFCERIV